MKINAVNKNDDNTAQIIIEIDAENFEKVLEKSYRKRRGSINVPGFRRGKAPRKIIEHMYGSAAFHEDAIETLAPEAFQFAVEQESLQTIGRPSLEDVNVSDEKTLTLTIKTALYPVVTLGTYKGITAPKAAIDVPEADIDAELATLQKRNARIVSVERAAALGDTTVIDFEGFIDETAFPGGKGEGHELLLGSDSFIPGFEEQLVGITADEEREVNVTFPEEYTPELAGKAAVFKVKCHEVKEQILPDLDDEFAKDISEFDTLDEVRADTRERLTKEREDDVKKRFESAVIEAAVESMTVTIPEVMIEDAINDKLREFFYSISSQGMEPEKYLQATGMDIDSLRQNARPAAEAQVKSELLFGAIVEAEDFSVTDEDIEAEYARLSEQYEMELDKLKESRPAEFITESIKRKRAVDLVIDSAIATEETDSDTNVDTAAE